MIVYIRIPQDVTISYRVLAEWKQKVGMPLNNELDPRYKGKVIDVAFFASEEDAIMFKLAFRI